MNDRARIEAGVQLYFDGMHHVSHRTNRFESPSLKSSWHRLTEFGRHSASFDTDLVEESFSNSQKPAFSHEVLILGEKHFKGAHSRKCIFPKWFRLPLGPGPAQCEPMLVAIWGHMP